MHRKDRLGEGNERTDCDDHGCGSAALEIEPFLGVHGTKDLEDRLCDCREYLLDERMRENKGKRGGCDDTWPKMRRT